MNRHHDPDVVRAAVPADVDAPDRIAYGLTARQLAIVAVAGLVCYGVFQGLVRWLPAPAAAAAVVPLAAAVVAVVLGRRDGLPLDLWLWAGLRFRRLPRLQAPAGATGQAAAAGQLVATCGPPPVPAPLKLPAEAITPDGQLRLFGQATAAVVACGTVNLALRTGAEQQALVGGFGRWLNSLQGGTQIVVSTQRMDLAGHAERLELAAGRLRQPALAAAAAGQAAFLRDLAISRDPLRRQVLVVVAGDTRGAHRRGRDTARALAAFGVHTGLLDGASITAALAAAIDPYSPPVGGARAAPTAVITGPSTPEAVSKE